MCPFIYMHSLRLCRGNRPRPRQMPPKKRAATAAAAGPDASAAAAGDSEAARLKNVLDNVKIHFGGYMHDERGVDGILVRHGRRRSFKLQNNYIYWY